jgi:hypothetical protein
VSKNRSQNSDTETQFLRSLQEVLRDLDQAHYTATRILIKQTKRLGVFLVEIDSWLLVEAKPVARIYESDGTFPNAQAKAMAAYIFSLASEHAIRVEEAVRTEASSIIDHWFGAE